MAKRIIMESIVVVRDGNRIVPEIGKVFDLTDGELAQLVQIRPQAVQSLTTVDVDPRSTPVDPGDGEPVALADRTRDELYDMAQEMDLSVAKNISKAKLIELIEDAETGGDGL